MARANACCSPIRDLKIQLMMAFMFLLRCAYLIPSATSVPGYTDAPRSTGEELLGASVIVGRNDESILLNLVLVRRSVHEVVHETEPVGRGLIFLLVGQEGVDGSEVQLEMRLTNS